MIDAFLQFTRDKFGLNPKSKILLAVSGGLDSTVMTHLFEASEYTFGIAHCNFNLRGQESDADAVFVRALAKKFDVPYFTIAFETEKYAVENKLSTEEAARNLRYDWFETIRKSFTYDFIATAHHLDDSLETTLLNFTKGTGIKGMQGIPVKNKKVIRPMLFTTRNAVMEFAVNNNIEYREDTSNDSNAFTRNKIRNTILPLLKEINPALESTFHQTNKNLIESGIIVDEFVQKKIKKHATETNGNIYLKISSLRNLPYATTLLYTLLHSKNFSADQVLQIANNLYGSGKTFLSKSHRVIIDRKFLIITGAKTEESSVFFVEENTRSLQTGNCTFEMDTISNKNFKLDLQTAYFDLSKISFPITVRKWRKGDYLYPVGLIKPNGNPARKKISDLFTDTKYNLLQKEETWIFVCGEKIIWVAGLRQDARFILKQSGNSDLLKIKMLPKKESIV